MHGTQLLEAHFNFKSAITRQGESDPWTQHWNITDLQTRRAVFCICILQIVAYLNVQHTEQISIHLRTCFCQWVYGGSILTSLPALVWSPPAPKQNISLFWRLMLHFIHQLVANFVFLLFGAGLLWEWTKLLKFQAIRPKQWTERHRSLCGFITLSDTFHIHIIILSIVNKKYWF